MANNDSSLEYDDNLEKLLKEQAEIAESLSILHRNAHRKYSRYTNLINIPVIIGSSAVGFTTGLDLSKVDNMNVILGVISVSIGIIKSLDSYFQLGRVSETHRMVSLAYSQINKKIAVELALNRKDRISPKDMLSIIKTDIKNLEDISPLIPEDIIDSDRKEFGDKYENIKKPNITNGLSPIEINTSGTPRNFMISADLGTENTFKRRATKSGNTSPEIISRRNSAQNIIFSPPVDDKDLIINIQHEDIDYQDPGAM